MIPDGIGMLYTNFQPPTPCAAGSENISFDFGHFAGTGTGPKTLYVSFHSPHIVIWYIAMDVFCIGKVWVMLSRGWQPYENHRLEGHNKWGVEKC